MSLKTLGMRFFVVCRQEATRGGEMFLMRLLANRTLGIRLSSEELERFDIKDSIHLSDGGYAVILAVHHNLHCLVSLRPLRKRPAEANGQQRRIRQTFYAEQYYPEWTEEDFAANRMHNCECLLCSALLVHLPHNP